jgi:hypothetical protein
VEEKLNSIGLDGAKVPVNRWVAGSLELRKSDFVPNVHWKQNVKNVEKFNVI